jgi:hypothetical protein
VNYEWISKWVKRMGTRGTRAPAGVQSDEIIEKILENEEAERAIYQLLGRNPQILRCAA